MAGTHRRYRFALDRPWPEGPGRAAVEFMINAQCTRRWWFREPAVDPDKIIFSFVVSGRDQWWCHRRAMRLASSCFIRIGLTSAAQWPEPTWQDAPGPAPAHATGRPPRQGERPVGG